MTLALNKCKFGVSELEYLGYHVSKEGIRPVEKKIEAISKFPKPIKQKQLLAFLGAINYYRASLPSLDPVDPTAKPRPPAEILEPLY